LDKSTDSAMESILEEKIDHAETLNKPHESLAFFTDIEYSDGKPIIISGIALAEGDWNQVRYGADEIKKAMKTLEGLAIKVEHSKSEYFKDKSVGQVIEVQWDSILRALKFRARIDDADARDMVCKGVLKSVSVQTYLDKIREENIAIPIATNLEFTELSLVEIPACSTCHIFHWESLSKKSREVKDMSETENKDNLPPLIVKAKDPNKYECPVCMEKEPTQLPVLTNEAEFVDHLKEMHPSYYIDNYLNKDKYQYLRKDRWVIMNGDKIEAEFDCPVKVIEWIKTHGEGREEEKALSAQCACSAVKEDKIELSKPEEKPVVIPPVVVPPAVPPTEVTLIPTAPVAPVAPVIEVPKTVEVPPTPTPTPIPIVVQPPVIPSVPVVDTKPQREEPRVVERIIERIIEREPPKVEVPKIEVPVPAVPAVPAVPTPPIIPTVTPVVQDVKTPEEILKDISVGELISILYARREGREGDDQ